jgi:hypothetical protein
MLSNPLCYPCIDLTRVYRRPIPPFLQAFRYGLSHFVNKRLHCLARESLPHFVRSQRARAPRTIIILALCMEDPQTRWFSVLNFYPQTQLTCTLNVVSGCIYYSLYRGEARINRLCNADTDAIVVQPEEKTNLPRRMM